jgi:hypothetical protein
MGLGTLSLCLLARFSSLEARGVRTAVGVWCPSEQHHFDEAEKVVRGSAARESFVFKRRRCQMASDSRRAVNNAYRCCICRLLIMFLV